MTGRHNPKVKLALSLTQRKYRERHGLILIEGERLIRQSLSFGARIEYVLAEPARAASLVDELARRGIPVLEVASNVIRRLSDTEQPQGVVAVARAANEDAVDFDSARRLLVFDRIQDPGNLGAMLRAAAAFAVDGAVFLSGTVDPKNPKALRSSAGAYFRVPLSTGWQAQELVERLKQAGFRLVAADARADRSAYSFDWRGKWALLVGNEGSGLDPRLVPADRVAIPMPGGMESLNVGVAASILLYEARRPRGGEGA